MKKIESFFEITKSKKARKIKENRGSDFENEKNQKKIKKVVDFLVTVLYNNSCVAGVAVRNKK